MADAAKMLALPMGKGSFAGALYQPLQPWRLIYRHGCVNPQWPWSTVPRNEPINNFSVWRRLKEKYNQKLRPNDVRDWEEAARHWIRLPNVRYAFGYIRVSHENSAQSGISFEIQVEDIIKYWQDHFENSGVKLGPLFCDSAVSARRVPFRARRGGKELLRTVRPGDHVLIYKLDRSFRWVRDAACVWEDEWKPKNITPHFLDVQIDLSTPDGYMMFVIMASVAQRMSDALSRKMKRVAARMTDQGIPHTGAHRGIGWKWTEFTKKNKKTGRLEIARRRIPDMEERAIMHEIARLRHVEKKKWTEISTYICTQIGEWDGEKFIPSKSAFHPVRRKWSDGKCAKACNVWHRLINAGHQQPVCDGPCCQKNMEHEGKSHAQKLQEKLQSTRFGVKLPGL